MTKTPKNPQNLIRVDYYTDLNDCSTSFDDFAHTYASLRASGGSQTLSKLKEPHELAQFLIELTEFYRRSL